MPMPSINWGSLLERPHPRGPVGDHAASHRHGRCGAGGDSTHTMTRVVAVDPGRAKCGLVLVDVEQRLVVAGSVQPAAVDDLLKQWCRHSLAVDGSCSATVPAPPTGEPAWKPWPGSSLLMKQEQPCGHDPVIGNSGHHEVGNAWSPRTAASSRDLDAVAALVMLEQPADHLPLAPQQPRPGQKRARTVKL